LPESIGDPDLLVGREKEFDLLDQWIGRIPRRVSKSRALLGRRKSGKTAIVQRIFNRLWSENGEVIPFYIAIAEKKMWLPNFAIEFFCTYLEADRLKRTFINPYLSPENGLLAVYKYAECFDQSITNEAALQIKRIGGPKCP